MFTSALSENRDARLRGAAALGGFDLLPALRLDQLADLAHQVCRRLQFFWKACNT